jgi:DNA-binding ferritin-like protein (Dps family)
MKKTLKGALLLQGCLLLAVAGTAQAADEPAERYIYGTYSVCDLTQQERADEIFKTLDKPFYDAAVADGGLAGYSYYAHQTGGKWRRGTFTVGPSIQALLDSQKKVGDQIEAKNKKLSNEYSKICNSHDDYIWRTVAGKAGTAATGDAVFSTYYVCDSREKQADAIITQVIAPIYDKMVADKKLTSWAYLEHIVGGRFRRVETMTATDMKSLMAARAELIQAYADNPLGDTFTEICDSHDDYMWEVTASGKR